MTSSIDRTIGRAGVRRLGFFGATVVLNGLMSLITIPVVVAVAGADAWASMATGQSIGASLAALVLFGWGLTGPATIAKSDPALRPGLYLESLAARLYLLLPLLLLQAAITFAIVPHAKVVAMVAGTAMLLAGVSANWYFTGAGRSGLFLALDTIPRVSGTLLGLLLVVTTHDLLFFALAQLAGSLFAMIGSGAIILRGSGLDLWGAFRWRPVVTSLVQQRHGVVATGLNAAYMPAVLAIVAVAAPTMLPVFVLANRLTGFIGMALSPMFMLFQGWVPAAKGVELARRIRISGSVTALAAVFSGALVGALLPTFGVILTHGEVSVDAFLAITFGVLGIIYTGSPYLSAVGLMSVGEVGLIARSTAVGVPLAILSLAVIESLGGAELGIWGLIFGSGLVAVWQILALRRAVSALPSTVDATRELQPAHP
jgi:hypothetical protein